MQNVVDLLSLPGLAVQAVQDLGEHLLIEATVNEVSLSCPLCSSTLPPYCFGSRPRLVSDLPIRMRPVQICVHRRRYRCRNCGSTYLDELQGIHPRHDATQRLVEYIEVHALELTRTFTSLAHDVGVSEWLIRDIVATQIGQLERAYVLQTPRYLGIDEIYMEDAIYCLLTDLERHCALDLLPRRDMETVKKWLRRLDGPTVQAVCMDHWNPYRLSVREVLPQARIVIDKFHVVRQVNEIAETVRKSLREELSPAQRRQLKQDHRILQKREKDLTPEQRLIVESWTGFVPVLKELLRLKEAFYTIYDAQSKQEAYTRYVAWEASIPSELYEAFLPLLLAIEEWGSSIFAFWELPVALTNAFTERTNLSLREATRVAFGLSFRVLRAKLLFCPSNTARLTAPPLPIQPPTTALSHTPLTQISTAGLTIST